MFSRSRRDRMERLARRLEQVLRRDRQRLEREREIAEIRRQAAAGLHALCARLTESLNAFLSEAKLELSPAEFHPERFDDQAVTLYQMNFNGRVVQMSFRATELVEESTALRIPYTLTGEVRWYNQEWLEREEVPDHQLFYCLGKTEKGWRYVDSMTQRVGLVDEEYLMGLLEELTR